MKIIRQPNRWSCMIAAFAMVLDCSIEFLLKLIEHDGSEIVRPDLKDPMRRRGFHIQEFAYALHQLGYSITEFDALPASAINDKQPVLIWPEDEALKRLAGIMEGNKGVLTGYTFQQRPHAVAWNGHEGYDPATGLISSIDDFSIETFWLVQSNQTGKENT